MKKLVTFLILFIYGFCSLMSQTSIISSIGYGNLLTENASGFHFGAGMDFRLSRKFDLQLRVNTFHSETKGLFGTLEENDVHSLGESGRKSVFPIFQDIVDQGLYVLETKPDKFTNYSINLACKYSLFRNDKFSIGISPGMGLSYISLKKIDEVFEPERVYSPWFGTLAAENFHFIIFRDQRYLDANLNFGAECFRRINKNIELGLVFDLTHMVFSKDSVFSLSLALKI